MVDHQAAVWARLQAPMPVEPARETRLRELDANPVPVRDAVTVALLRDGPPGCGIETYLLRRSPTMAFAPHSHVFPGGRVDPADRGDGLPWAGPPVPEVCPGLDADPGLARAVLAAAVRETFEECGVLVAGPGSATPGPARAGGTEWLADRRALERREVTLSEVLARRGLVLRADLLAPWARWVTPRTESHRYDTRILVAAVPVGQEPGEPSTEAVEASWVRPADAVRRFLAGELAMLPPTAVTLSELAGFDEVAAVLAATRGRTLTPLRPRTVFTPGAVHWRLPSAAEPPTALHSEGAEQTVVPAVPRPGTPRPGCSQGPAGGPPTPDSEAAR